jgi:PP-loop superfamily ATP-utilizing enzyme
MATKEAGFNKDIIEEPERKVRKTIIECTLCGTKFNTSDYSKNNAANSCYPCSNVIINVIKPPLEDSSFEYYVTVRYKKERPLIYEEGLRPEKTTKQKK